MSHLLKRKSHLNMASTQTYNPHRSHLRRKHAANCRDCCYVKHTQHICMLEDVQAMSVLVHSFSSQISIIGQKKVLQHIALAQKSIGFAAFLGCECGVSLHNEAVHKFARFKTAAGPQEVHTHTIRRELGRKLRVTSPWGISTNYHTCFCQAKLQPRHVSLPDHHAPILGNAFNCTCDTDKIAELGVFACASLNSEQASIQYSVTSRWNILSRLHYIIMIVSTDSCLSSQRGIDLVMMRPQVTVQSCNPPGLRILHDVKPHNLSRSLYER